MANLVSDYIAALKPYPPGKPIEEVQRELGVTDVLKVASNECPIGPSPKALEAIKGALGNLNIYPDGGGYYLKGAIGERLGFDRSEIILGNGSNELLELLIRTFMSPGGLNAVTSETTFIVYKLVMQACGADLREAPMDGYTYDLDAMAELVDINTRLVFIANPNNPTGTYVTADALERFITTVDERCSAGPNGPPIMVLDEAYCEYVDAVDYPDGIGWVRKRPRTIVMRTFSKAYGLAGLRCGYGLASADLINLMNRVRQPFNVNSLALAGCVAALEDQAYLEEVVGINRTEKHWLAEQLRERGGTPVPTQTNFVLVDFGVDTAELYVEMQKKGVIVRPMASYGLPTTIRITVGNRAQNERILAALDACTDALKA